MSSASLNGHEKAIVERLRRLVEFDTQNPPGNEAGCASFIGAEMTGLGCEVAVKEVIADRPNAIGVFRNGDGPTFAFNTHMDVVQAGTGWTSNPLVLTDAGDSFVARGACDAKGPLSAMIEAMRMLIARASEWQGTLMGIFVIDEESESLGAKSLVGSDLTIDFCIIGEPTSCKVVTAHKGSMRPVVRVHGVSAHSASPQLGRNAILLSAPLLEEIGAEHQRLQAFEHPLLARPSLTVTRAWGGHASNAVAEHCDFLLDRRLIAGENEAEVEAELHALVDRVARRADTPVRILEFRPTTGGPTETDADHPLVRAAQAAAEHHNGRPDHVRGFQGGCDLVHFRRIGAAGVVIGPGSIDVAHKPDESIPKRELLRSALIYRDIVLKMLSPKQPESKDV